MACQVIPTLLPNITRCPPMPARYLLKDDPIFSQSHISPAMGATFDSDGDAHTKNLSFNDTQSMTVQTHKAGRRREIPEWALNPASQTLVLVNFLETKAFGNCRHKPSRTGLSLQERLAKAQRKLDWRAKHQILPMLDDLCRRFVECSDPKARERLAQRIRAADMQIRVIKRGPGLALRVWTAAYSRGLDSVGIAQECKISAVLTRQILHRGNKAWRRIQRANENMRSESERAAAQQALNQAKKELADVLREQAVAVQRARVRAKREYRKKLAKATYARDAAQARLEIVVDQFISSIRHLGE